MSIEVYRHQIGEKLKNKLADTISNFRNCFSYNNLHITVLSSKVGMYSI